MIIQSLKLIWRRKTSNGLLVLEFFLTFLALYVTGALIFDGIHRYSQPDGFDIENVVSIVAYKNHYAGGSDSDKNLLPYIANTLKNIPSVENVGLLGRELYNRRLVGRKVTVNGMPVIFSSAILSDACKDILHIDLIQGSWFSAQDNAGQYEPVLINAKFRDDAFSGENPLGTIIDSQYQVIGVVADLKIFSEFDEPQPLLIKRTTFDNPDRSHALIAKLTSAPTGDLITTMLEVLQAVDSDWTFVITPAEELRVASIKEDAAPYVIAGMTALLLICMVVMGLFGVLWQNIASRTREFGLRRAKGANISDIYTQIIGEMLLVTTVAILPGVLIVAQLMMMDVMGYIPLGIHVVALSCAAAFLYLMVVTCSLYPGYMATRINPAEALRYE